MRENLKNGWVSQSDAVYAKVLAEMFVGLYPKSAAMVDEAIADKPKNRRLLGPLKPFECSHPLHLIGPINAFNPSGMHRALRKIDDDISPLWVFFTRDRSFIYLAKEEGTWSETEADLVYDILEQNNTEAQGVVLKSDGKYIELWWD